MKVLLVCLLLLLTHSSIIGLKKSHSANNYPQSSKRGYSFSLNSLASSSKGSSQVQTQGNGDCSGPVCNSVPTTDVSNLVEGSGNKVYG